MRNGEQVAAFERAFAEYVGAKYAIALCNGTATLHAALVALGVRPGDRVATTPLTMSATSIAILQAGAVPFYCDVQHRDWLMYPVGAANVGYQVPVSLYGLHYPTACHDVFGRPLTIDDAAQTLRPADPRFAFTSYSFQASKILSLGEGGMLATNDEELAQRAREFSSLGYRMRADQPRINPDEIKANDYERHHSLGWNYRMNDLTAKEGLRKLESVELEKEKRKIAASFYETAIKDADWITPQYVPQGWSHDYWCYAIALKDKALVRPLSDSIVKHGGERPYGAWRLTYGEPAFKHLTGTCSVAENLQPRLLQLQTNDLKSAERNSNALWRAIQEIESRSHKPEWKMFEGTVGTPCE